MENICFEYDGYNCSVLKQKYHNGQIRLQLFDTFDGMPFMTATVVIDSYKLSKEEITEGYTFIKDYGENDGILKILIDNKVVEDIGRTYPGVHKNITLVKVLI